MSAYIDREQTKAKHFILRGYLQELSFKVLRGWDITYVDGFSGPWESKTEDYSDTSFMIAIKVLRDAQEKVAVSTGVRRKIKCFFAERDLRSYQQMAAAVAEFNNPDNGFELKTFHGDFVNAVPDIQKFSESSFSLIFIDPTGWTEYPLAKIAPLFEPKKCEALINFMYGHISRFLSHQDKKIIASLDPILGGPGWRDRLDPNMKIGLAVEKLFRENLKSAGNFKYVVSTKIDKSTQNRPHFFLAYATKDRAGLNAFREIEYKALREHERSRSAALTRKRQIKTGVPELFPDHDADHREASIEEVVEDQKLLAKEHLLKMLGKAKLLPFNDVADELMQTFMLRENNVKDVCVELFREGKLVKSWGTGNRKPNSQSTITLTQA